MVRLRARLPVLWLAPTSVQIGTDPRWSVALHDLSPSATHALLEVPQGADERGIRAALDRRQVPTTEAEAVLAHLRAARLLVDAPVPDSPDAAAWALVEADGHASTVRSRAAARVRVSGLCRLGAGIAMTLGAAGVGQVELDDARPVGRNETGWAGLTLRDVGTPRAAAVARALHDATPARTPRPGSGAVDLVVHVEHWVADPVRHAPHMTNGVAHLSVVLREASVLVGPLVLPGRTPCLRCVDAHRTELDPTWPTVAAQLAVTRSECPAETALAAVGGALATVQALAHLDGRPVAGGAVTDVGLPDLVPRVWQVTPHPECGCCGLSDG